MIVFNVVFFLTIPKALPYVVIATQLPSFKVDKVHISPKNIQRLIIFLQNIIHVSKTSDHFISDKATITLANHSAEITLVFHNIIILFNRTLLFKAIDAE